MKKILLAGIAGVALLAGAPAHAADLGPRPAYKAPPAPMPLPFSWTGCYIGGQLGGGWGPKDWTDLGDDNSDNVSYTAKGVVFGGQIGCDYQWTSQFLFGVEASFAGADIKGSALQPFERENATVSTKIDWLATLTARAGFVMGPALIYVKGGGAWARESHTTLEVDLEEGTFGFGQDQSFSTTASGWLIGGGLEYALGAGWSAKLEYNYMDFGHKSFLFDQLSGDPVDVRQRLHTLTFGVNYRFNWGLGKGPVAARY